MRDFQYHAPTSLKDVYALLGEHGEDSRLISGGTGLINMMKQDLIAVDHLVSIQNVITTRANIISGSNSEPNCL